MLISVRFTNIVKNAVEGKAYWTLQFWMTAKNYKTIEESSNTKEQTDQSANVDGIVLQEKTDGAVSV